MLLALVAIARRARVSRRASRAVAFVVAVVAVVIIARVIAIAIARRRVSRRRIALYPSATPNRRAESSRATHDAATRAR